MKIGIFGDIHFQPKGLERIVKTGDWIIEEFKRHGVDQVVCLGDALVTREDVDVASQSYAIDFFKRLGDTWPTKVILGNHDMNLKHARHVSSLDSLVLHPNIKLFRELAAEKNGDTTFLLIPYHEDQTEILKKISSIPESLGKDIIVFGHLSLNGAVQNTRYNTKFDGAMGPDVFKNFRRTYTGHFHVFQEMDHHVTYVGSPLQFNFGDAGDKRGVLVYDTETNSDQFILNPFYDAFKVIQSSELDSLTEETVKNCFVTVIYDDIVTKESHEQVQQKLESLGALQVRKESVIEKAIRSHEVDIGEVKSTNAEGLVEPFVKQVLSNDSQLIPDSVIQIGKGIIKEVNEKFQDVADTGLIFEADIKKLTIENFLGVQNEIVVDFDEIKSGVWFIEGANGAGKTSFTEAIYWAQFNDTLRSDMKADWVVNDKISKNCRVRIDYRNGYSIERFRKYRDLGGVGVKVYKDGVYQEKFEKGVPAATDKAIVDLLGIDAATFSRSIVLGQNVATNFISSGDKERRALIEQSLGLERFDSYLEKTREFKKSLSNELEQQDTIQKVRSQSIAQAATNIQQVELQILKSEKDHEQKQINAANNLSIVEKEISELPEKYKEDETLLQNAITKSISEIERIKAEIEAHDIRSRGLESVKTLEAESQRISSIIASVSSLTKKYEISKEENKNKIAQKKLELEKLKTRLEQYSKFDFDDALKSHKESQELKSHHSSLLQQIAVLESEKRSKTADATKYGNEANRLLAIGKSGGNCPTCTQSVDMGKIQSSYDSLTENHSKALEEQSKITTQISLLTEEAKNILESVSKLIAGKPTPEQISQLKANWETDKERIKVLEKEFDELIQGCYHSDFSYKDELEKLAPNGVQELQKQLQVILVNIEVAKKESGYDPIAHRSSKEKLITEEKQLNFHNDNLSRHQIKFNVASATLKERKESILSEIKSLASTNPKLALQETLQNLKNAQQLAFEDLEKAKAMAFNISQKQAYIAFWEKAFAQKGSMRAFLLDESVKNFNSLLASYLDQHFGGKMSLTFNSDLTVQERYGCRSGGQRKWTDLCALFALFEIVRQRTRYRSGFLALDEVFDALDAQGRRAVQDMLAILSARVKTILVITHAEIAGVTRAGTIKARMTDQGTKIEVKAT